MRPHHVAIAAVLLCNILPSTALPQARPALTADDYARAERFLGPTAGRLVSGIPGRPIWLPDGRAAYRVSTPTGGGRFGMVDPRRRTRAAAFDHARLAEAVSAALGRRVTGDSLPFSSFDLSPDGQLIFESGKRWRCDLTAYRCTAAESPRRAPPSNSILSPDSTRAVFIRNNNLWMTDLTSGVETALTTDGIEDFGYATNNAGWVKSDEPVVTWSPDSRKIAVRTLREEQAKTQVGEVGVAQNWRVLPGSNELIWWSERDGWIHLYLYDLTTGRLKNRITSSDGNVESIGYVDERARAIYFSGEGMERGRDPYYRFLYRVRFDGRGQTLLTPEDADHQVAMAPDGASFIDSYSTPVTPPATVLRDRNGRVVIPLARADISRLVAAGWHPPTQITVKARDGTTDLYGLMFTPSRLDSTAKYPLVDYIYPMPSGSVGPRGFVPARGDHQALAELGFVVVAIDGMGTRGGRSKTFRDAAYGKIEENTLPDQVAAIKQLAARYPWIDGERVGIWGHSGGGFATAAAMFNYPDVFKVGISESGNHDNRNYEDDWGERYQGLLVRNGESDNYAADANQMHGANLRGKLLLAHGGMDDNVPPYNTYLVVDALIKANKDFDLLILPNARHGYGRDGLYMMRRRWDYFVRNLLGAEPPQEYEIGKKNPAAP